MIPAKLSELEEILCQAANVQRPELRSKTRNATVVAVRQAIWLIAHDYMGYSYSSLGDLYRRDHTTIISGVARFKKGGLAEKVVAEITRVAPDLLVGLSGNAAHRTVEQWDFKKCGQPGDNV